MFGLHLNAAMDEFRQKAFSESLKATLNCYQLASVDSLSGPSGFPAIAAQLWFKENKASPPIPRPPLVQVPFLIPNDVSTQRSEAFLRGERIFCFVVGGEKRLCLAQILTTVLRDFSMLEINKACAELHIYCSRCSPEQLEILKVLDILPFNTTQCGLITRSDAERLVSSLQMEYNPSAEGEIPNHLRSRKSKRIPVYHESFGRGFGHFYPDLYVAPDAACIACENCRITLSPSRFVTHSHHGLEKRTCHWGFDSNNWRSYILLSEDTDPSQREVLERQLDTLKTKFHFAKSAIDLGNTSSSLKRKSAPENKVEYVKRVKEENTQQTQLVSPKSASPMDLRFPFGLPSSLCQPLKVSIPPGLTPMSEMQAVQQEAFIKAFVHGVQDRSSTKSTELPPVPNVAIEHAQKRTGGCAREEKYNNDVAEGKSKNRNVEDKPSKTVAIKIKTEAFESLKSFHPHNNSTSFPVSPCIHHVSEEQKRPPQTTHSSTSLNPLSMKKKLAKEICDKLKVEKPQEQAVNLSSGLQRSKSRDEERRSIDVISSVPREISENSSKCQDVTKAPSVVAMSNVVEAASAMLELSASMKYSSGNNPSSSSSYHYSSAPSTYVKTKTDKSHPPLSCPKVSPVDSHYVKWTFPSNSYMISISGSKELMSFQTLLDRIEKESLKIQLFEEIVKMKSRVEERLEFQRTINQDTEKELERLKASQKQCLERAAIGSRKCRKELKQVRNESHRHAMIGNQSFITLGQQLVDLPPHSNDHEKVMLQHKILDKLHKKINEKEESARKLEMQLQNEKDQRMEVERRMLEEIADRSRNELSLLTQQRSFPVKTMSS